jgi:hypothetical protein
MKETPEETPEEKILSLILGQVNLGPHDLADCQRCIKIALHAVGVANNVRLISGAARHKLTDRALKGLLMIAAAVRDGASSPIPGFDEERLKERVEWYSLLHAFTSINRGHRHRGNKRAAKGPWGYELPPVNNPVRHSESKRAAAAHWAYSLLVRYDIKPTKYPEGTWCKLARELYGRHTKDGLVQVIRDYDPIVLHPVNDAWKLYGVLALQADGTTEYPDDLFEVHVKFSPDWRRDTGAAS